MYGLGTMIIAFGVVMVIKSDLGTGPWDTVFIVLARRIDGLTIGLSAILVTSLLTIITTALRQDITLLAMIVPIVFVGGFIDLFNLVLFDGFTPVGMLRAGVYGLGVALVPLGGALLVVSQYPAGVFEEMTLLLRDLFHLNHLFSARMMIELFPVILSATLAWIWFNDFGAISIGTLGFIVFIGPLFQWYLARLDPAI